MWLLRTNAAINEGVELTKKEKLKTKCDEKEALIGSEKRSRKT